MNLEEEIYKIFRDYFGEDLTYGRSFWIDNKDLQELADRIAEVVKKQKLALIKEDIIEVLKKYNARYIKPVDITEMINCNDNVSSSPFDINHDRIASEILNKVGVEEKHYSSDEEVNDALINYVKAVIKQVKAWEEKL